MADADLQITFGADASAVQSGAAAAAASIRSIKPALQETIEVLKVFSGAMARAFKAPDAGGAMKAAAGLAQQSEQAARQSVAARVRAVDEETQATIRGARDQLSAQKVAIADHIAALRQALALGQISRAEETAAVQADYRQQAADAERAALTEYLATAERLNARINAEAVGSAKQEALIAERIEAWRAYETRREQISIETNKIISASDAQATTAVKQQWASAIGPIVSQFSHGLEKMAEGTQTFSQTIRGMGQSILNAWIGNIDKMVTKWASGQIAQLSASRATTAAKTALETAGAAKSVAVTGTAAGKSILSDAAAAAAAAYHAMAGIPVIGPVLGAAAAATVFSAALAFRGMIASAAGGYDIPAGTNPLVQAHAEEMILPARLANPMRSMIADYSAGGGNGGLGGPASVSIGDTHFHGVKGDPGEFRKLLADHRDDLVKHVYAAVRGGSRAPRGVASPFST